MLLDTDKSVYWHDMKFWWPHNEAIIATLLAWQLTGDVKYAGRHEQVHDWAFKHFADPDYGEWYGYLHRDGRLSVPLKGNLWKSFFHHPRALWYAARLAEEGGQASMARTKVWHSPGSWNKRIGMTRTRSKSGMSEAMSRSWTRRLGHAIRVVPGVWLGVALLCLATLPGRAQSAEELIAYLRSLGQGQYLFGQMATWVHNENPDMDHPSNWLKKVHEHTGVYPRYACITYDFHDDPFSDAQWNEGVKKFHDRGMIPGVYNFWANPCGGAWNDPCASEQIRAPGENPVKTHFYRQMDRMAANLQWLKERGVTVVYTPFVESDDRNKWHAKQGSENIIQLYRLVHDYFTKTKGLENLVWAYHTTQRAGALQAYYPGDEYVDVIGKSAYGTGLVFDEYAWAVDKKQNHGKVIWWAELGIRGQADPPRDCLDVLRKLESAFPELCGFVFWSDEGLYNVVGNLNGATFMEHPKIITLGE